MYSGISGLKAFSEQTSVISNNIANSSTVGFKSGSVAFADVFYSALNTSGTGTGQVGNGVSISSVETDFTQGSYESGSNATDLALDGDGFFIVKDTETESTYYTRAGNFSFNNEGYLVDTNGYIVQGWVTDEGSASGTITDIKLDDFQSPPQETETITMSLNLDSSSTDNASDDSLNPFFSAFAFWDGTQSEPMPDSRYSYQTSITTYDENGTSHEMTVYMDPVGEANDDGNMVWEYIVAGNPEEDSRIIDGVDISETEAAGLYMTGTFTFNSSGEMIDMSAFTLDESSGVLSSLADPSADIKDLDNWVPASFSDDGLVSFHVDFTGAGSADLENSQTIAMDFGLSNTGLDWDTTIANAGEITDASQLPTFESKNISAMATTCYDASSATYSQTQDGYNAGYLQDVSVDSSGILSGIYSNGQTLDLFAIALADFNNTDGLYQEGGNLFSATPESGVALTGQAGQSGLGEIVSYTLESSNVDMSEELTSLIVAQSAFQANSKIVTTVDDMLSTVLSMKR
jgi:flagellar hook protein FlgE